MKPETVYMMSLGCPKNQVDSEVMLGLLGSEGCEMTYSPEEAQLIIVNTCCFIEEAREEAVDVILSMAEFKEKGVCERLVVTGCFPQRYGRDLASALPEVDLFIGTEAFGDIVRILSQNDAGDRRRIRTERSDKGPYGARPLPRLLSTSRGTAYLKISEGCSNRCSYCAVPGIRGELRSRPLDSILEEVHDLVSMGVKEIIPVAQDLTAYGIDMEGSSDLCGLLDALDGVDGIEWIRLLYCHPGRVGPALAERIRSESKVCPYIDIPVQHISAKLLNAMNRGTDPEAIEGVIGMLRSTVSDIAIRSSLIVGFPGEGDEEFEALIDFVKRIEFEHLGVFAFSPEEGTPAASMDGQVSEAVSEERRSAIMAVQAEISFENNLKSVGECCDVLIDEFGVDGTAEVRGRSARQAPDVDGFITLDGSGLEPGMIVRARLTGADVYDLEGVVVETCR